MSPTKPKEFWAAINEKTGEVVFVFNPGFDEKNRNSLLNHGERLARVLITEIPATGAKMTSLRIAAYIVRAVCSFPGYMWRWLRGEREPRMKFRPEDVDMPQHEERAQ